MHKPLLLMSQLQERPSRQQALDSLMTCLQGGHGLQLERVPQHDIAVQAPTSNEAVCSAPVNSPAPLSVPFKILASHPGLDVCQAQPFVQGAGQNAV